MNNPNTLERHELTMLPTSNDMLDGGLWRAPALASNDPRDDSRAGHAVHFFPRDAPFSMCGKRFAADHFSPWSAAEGDRRRRCDGCASLLGTTRLSNTMAKTVPIAIPQQDVFTQAEFEQLISGNGGVALRLTRTKALDGTLYLFADFGLTAAPALRQALKVITRGQAVTATVIVWASTRPAATSRNPRLARRGGFPATAESTPAGE